MQHALSRYVSDRLAKELMPVDHNVALLRAKLVPQVWEGIGHPAKAFGFDLQGQRIFENNIEKREPYKQTIVGQLILKQMETMGKHDVQGWKVRNLA